MVSNWFEYEDVSRDELKLNEQFNWIDYYPSPALITDKFWTILRANPPFLSLSGYPENKITGRNIALLINPDSIVSYGSLNGSEQGMCHLKTASDSEIACTIAKKTINIGNEPHRIVSLTPLIKDQDHSAGSSAESSAMLEETQAALRESQMRLQQVQQLSEIGSWDVTFGPVPSIRT